MNKHLEVEGSTDEELIIRCMEEAAEIVQAGSKMLRFGITDRHPTYYKGRNNIEHFFDEYVQFNKIADTLLKRYL